MRSTRLVVNPSMSQKSVSSSVVVDWDPSQINVRAFSLLCSKGAQAFSPLVPETDAEKAFVRKWRESFEPEEREKALETTMNYFLGGALQAAIRARRTRPQKRRRWREV